MSRIDELLEQLCPDGVEYKTLGEIGSLYSGLSGKSKADFGKGDARFVTYKNVFDNPSVSCDAVEPVVVKPNERQNRLELGDILFTGSSETPNEAGMSSVVTELPESPLYLNSFCFGYRLFDKAKFLPDFLKHLFRSGLVRRQIVKTASGVTRFNVSKKRFLQVVIPIPPIMVQQKIVRVLDTYVELKAELEEELEEELEARHSQFDYYRNRLLTASAEAAAKVPLAKVGTFTGSTPKKSEQTFFGDEHPFYKPGDFDAGESIGTSEDGLTSEGLAASRVVPQDATMVVCIGATIGKIGYALETGSCNQQINVILPNDDFNPRYVFHLANSRIVQDQIVRLGNFSSMPILSLKKFNQIEIPMPPREVQDRVANVLDKLDAIVHDISDEIPAEISARQAQYAYYRDRLLTFRERVA